jgi:hypothetical protein
MDGRVSDDERFGITTSDDHSKTWYLNIWKLYSELKKRKPIQLAFYYLEIWCDRIPCAHGDLILHIKKYRVFTFTISLILLFK